MFTSLSTDVRDNFVCMTGFRTTTVLNGLISEKRRIQLPVFYLVPFKPNNLYIQICKHFLEKERERGGERERESE